MSGNSSFKRQSNISKLSSGRASHHVALPSSQTPFDGTLTLHTHPTSYTPSAYNPVTTSDNLVQTESLNPVATSSPSPPNALPPVPETDTVRPPTDIAPATDTAKIEVTESEQQLYARILEDLDALTRPKNRSKSQLLADSELSQFKLGSASQEQVSDLDEEEEAFMVKKHAVVSLVDSALEPMFTKPENDKYYGRVQQVDHFGNELAVGRRAGFEIFSTIFFSAFTKGIRYTTIISEFVFIAIDLILDIASLASGNNEGYVIAHLIFILLCLLLALVDGFVNLVSDNERCSCTGKLRCCCAMKNKVDMARVILPNILLTPILVCDLFDIITSRGFSGEDAGGTIGFIVFMIDIFYTFIFLKVINIIIAITVLLRLKSLKLHNENTGDTMWAELKLYKRRLTVYCCFLVHSFLYTIGDFFLLAAIGVQIRYENDHFYEPSNTDMKVKVGIELFFMCFFVCIMPFLQLLFFLIVYYFWTQESLVSLMVDFDDLKSKPDLFVINGKSRDEQERKMSKIFTKRVKMDAVRNQLKKSIKKVSWWVKLNSPFANPALLFYVIIPYALCYLIFYALAGSGYNEYYADLRDKLGSAPAAITVISFLINFAINFYLIIGTLVSFFYYLAIWLYIWYVWFKIVCLCNCEDLR